MGSISKFCERMRYWCEDANLGYDQSNRWDFRVNGESDCSSLVIHAAQESGFDTGDATYTGNMSEEFCKHGWKRIPFTSTSQVRAGDILLNDLYHTCAVISGSGSTAIIAQASIDERGRAAGGQAGDQTGNETNTRQVYVYSRGWDCILRYTGADDGGDVPADGKLEVDGIAGKKTIAEWQEQCGTEPDGVVSGQLQSCSDWYPNLTSVTFEGTGSALMRRVQEIVGVPNPTGIIARGTICYLQGWLVLRGYDLADAEAGMLDAPTAMAVQRSLNDGAWSDEQAQV